MKKISIISSLILCGTLCSPLHIMAAVKPGETFSGSASCGVYEGAVSVSGNNASITSADNWCNRGATVSASATAGSAGSASISFTVVDATDTEKMELVGNVNIGGTSVNVEQPVVQKPATNNTTTNQTPQTNTQQQTQSKPAEEPKEDTRSKDTTLKSLSVSGYELSPKFDATTTSYKVNVPAETTSIEVKASANDSKASVSGTGKIDVVAGENEVNVVVTSEYGTKQTYKITVYVDEKPLVYTSYVDQELGVVRNVNGVKVPEGFKKTTVTLAENEIPAWTNEKIGKTFVYLSNDKDEKSFYLFEEGKVSTKVTYTELLGRKFFIVDVPADKQAMQGMTYGDVTIDNTTLKGWTFQNQAFENYVLIYVMGMDGEMKYYQYEKTENILQLYSNAAAVTQKEYDQQTMQLTNAKKNANMWMYVAIASWVVVIVGAGVGYYFYRKK